MVFFYQYHSFLRVKNLDKKKDANIAKLIMAILEQNDIDLKNCRSQGYNNGANMSGVYEGVQAIILQKNPQALYMPCSAHNLNLAGVHSVESSVEVKTNLAWFSYFTIFLVEALFDGKS